MKKHPDLIFENFETIMDLLNEWDYDAVGLALLPPVTGNELRLWIEESIMNEYPYPVRITKGLPEHLRFRGARNVGRWEWLRRLIVHEMGQAAQRDGLAGRAVEFPNKSEMQSAQSAASTVNWGRKERTKRTTHFDSPEYKVSTRSEPVKNKNGAYYLHLEVVYKRQSVR